MKTGLCNLGNSDGEFHRHYVAATGGDNVVVVAVPSLKCTKNPYIRRAKREIHLTD
jgi:hypothetical protein